MDTTRLHGAELLIGGLWALTMFSSVTSSPWTMENVGADAAHAASARRLVNIAVVAAVVASAGAALLDRNWWPLVGGAGGAAFMAWLYNDALNKAQQKGYTGLNMGTGP